jgi:hypothetical protein
MQLRYSRGEVYDGRRIWGDKKQQDFQSGLDYRFC